MSKTHRQLIIFATALSLVLASGFMLATSYGIRTRQQAMRLHTRNSISALTFSISTNALTKRQSQSP